LQMIEAMNASDLNQPLYENRTALDWTIDMLVSDLEDDLDMSEWASVIHKLIEQGADPNQAVTSSSVAEESALYKLLAALRVLCKASQDRDRRQRNRARLETTITNSLIELGKATISTECQLLLHQAARRGELAFVDFLIQQLHVDANVCNRQNMTALQFAARSGQLQVVMYLLGLPCIQVDASDSAGQTALDAARVNGKDEVVKVLEEYLKNQGAPETSDL
jgi:ankyrin repeat protein